MISSITVRKIIFFSSVGHRSLSHTAEKFSPIARICASSSLDNAYRISSSSDNLCLVSAIASSFSFQRRSNSLAARRFLASTALYCSKAFLASYSSCSSLLVRAIRAAASPTLNSSSARRLASTPTGEITLSSSLPTRRSTDAPPNPMQFRRHRTRPCRDSAHGCRELPSNEHGAFGHSGRSEEAQPADPVRLELPPSTRPPASLRNCAASFVGSLHRCSSLCSLHGGRG